MSCQRCLTSPKVKGMCQNCYQKWWREGVKMGTIVPKGKEITNIICPYCDIPFKEGDIISVGMHLKCRTLYRKQTQTQNQHPLFNEIRGDLRILLLRFKWGRTTPIDYYKLAHYYLLLKSPMCPPFYNQSAIKPMLKYLIKWYNIRVS